MSLLSRIFPHSTSSFMLVLYYFNIAKLLIIFCFWCVGMFLLLHSFIAEISWVLSAGALCDISVANARAHAHAHIHVDEYIIVKVRKVRRTSRFVVHCLMLTAIPTRLRTYFSAAFLLLALKQELKGSRIAQPKMWETAGRAQQPMLVLDYQYSPIVFQ